VRVLLLVPMKDGQTGPAIKYGFEQLGHIVTAVDVKEHLGASFKVACDFKPDLILCSRTSGLAKQIVQIKKELKNVVACTWNVDTRSNINHWKHLFPLIQACDYYFVVASKLIPEWKKLNLNTFWLPQGLQNEVYRKPMEITDEDREKYACDVCWAGGGGGGGHGFRRAYLDVVSAMGINFKRWGTGGNPPIYNEEHNKMVALSKINLALSGWSGNEKYTSVRNYKILGAGGFCLELHRKGIYEIFPHGMIKCFTNPSELKNRIAYWLGKEQEQKRLQIADAGYRWVHANATYTHRMKMALEYMGMR